jgi:pimeloyl-ACP methyl ester carboxylesterase
MPTLSTDDGVKLYYEETGSGTPIVFVHEFAGDYRSWEPQVRHFSRRYRCITFNARGYPPSDVPPDMESYSQQHARDDIRCVLDGLSPTAHVVGFDRGFTLPSAWLVTPRALSWWWPVRLAQCPIRSIQGTPRSPRTGNLGKLAATPPGTCPLPPGERVRGFLEFLRNLSEHSAQGSANTMRGYQARRPSLYDLTAEMARIAAPVMIVAGDADDAALEPSLLMKRTIPGAALAVLPASGHMTNLEEPALFNRLVEDFFHQAEAGRWTA